MSTSTKWDEIEAALVAAKAAAHNPPPFDDEGWPVVEERVVVRGLRWSKALLSALERAGVKGRRARLFFTRRAAVELTFGVSGEGMELTRANEAAAAVLRAAGLDARTRRVTEVVS